MRAVVIGGGLAGITAALALADDGADVTLLEAKPRLGGATMSFSRDGLVVDTGQHVFLRCCTAYRGLLDRLGMSAHAPLQPRFDVTVLHPGGRARLRRAKAPAPLHLGPALARYKILSYPERIMATRAALAFRRVDPEDPGADSTRLGDWMAARGQSDHVRRALWDLFTIATLNVPGDDASLALAAKVVRTGLLADSGAADIGVPALPLGELHGAAAQRKLASLGARVRLNTKVEAVSVLTRGEMLARGDDPPMTPRGHSLGSPAAAGSVRAGRPVASADRAEARPGTGAGEGGGRDAGRGGFLVRLARGGEAIEADAVVLAVPHEAAARLMPPGALPRETVGGWAGLGAAPIVNVHVIYDRKVMDLPFAAAVDSPVQWVFDRTRISGMHARGGAGQLSPGGATPRQRSPGGHPPDPRTRGMPDAVPTRGTPPDPPASVSGMQYLAVSLSAADEYVDQSVAELRERFVPALAGVLPEARDARVTEFFVTRERRATFRQVPGSGRLRPRSETGLPGLVLAGSWTDTGWPDTMEGAVRSGLNAVRALRAAGVVGLTATPSARPPGRRSSPGSSAAGNVGLTATPPGETNGDISGTARMIAGDGIAVRDG